MFFPFTSISLLTPSTLNCLAAITKLLFHLLWPLTTGEWKFETRACQELPHCGTSTSKETDVLSLSQKDRECLCKKHNFHQCVKKQNKKQTSIFCFLFCLEAMHLRSKLNFPSKGSLRSRVSFRLCEGFSGNSTQLSVIQFSASKKGLVTLTLSPLPKTQLYRLKLKNLSGI